MTRYVLLEFYRLVNNSEGALELDHLRTVEETDVVFFAALQRSDGGPQVTSCYQTVVTCTDDPGKMISAHACPGHPCLCLVLHSGVEK